jgi:CRP-like cAMP-binding protein
LPTEDLQLIQPQLTLIELKQGETLHRQLERISHVYFPLQGMVSLVIDMSEGQSIEAGMIGMNGTVGGSSALDGHLALNRAIVQVEGSAQRIPAELLKKIAERSQSLRRALFQGEQVISAHAQQIAACNALHDLEARLARWLLQVRDLVQNSKFDLTQEFLAQMLGVRRTSVTLVAKQLQSAGLIKYRRGRIEILDAEALQDAACECYGSINEYYRILTGWQPETVKKISLEWSPVGSPPNRQRSRL